MTRAEWNKLLDKTPDDWELRRVFVTWLVDEEGDLEEAALQEWMVAEKVRPDPFHEKWYGHDSSRWYWSSTDSIDGDLLPTGVYQELGKVKLRHDHGSVVGYNTRLEAEQDLKQALRQLGLLQGASMTTLPLDALWIAVEQRPDDWDRWLVLADALNDAGDERTERAVRWCVEKGKRPEVMNRDPDNNPTHYAWSYRYVGSDMSFRLPFDYDGGPSFRIERTFPAAIRWLAGELERQGL